MQTAETENPDGPSAGTSPNSNHGVTLFVLYVLLATVGTAAAIFQLLMHGNVAG
ncbi:MAG: hypothetical protein JJ979_11845 [Roseibium sp.]|nr:hypothetical protein [Roseibium sp.]